VTPVSIYCGINGSSSVATRSTKHRLMSVMLSDRRQK